MNLNLLLKISFLSLIKIFVSLRFWLNWTIGLVLKHLKIKENVCVSKHEIKEFVLSDRIRILTFDMHEGRYSQKFIYRSYINTKIWRICITQTCCAIIEAMDTFESIAQGFRDIKNYKYKYQISLSDVVFQLAIDLLCA